MKDKVYKKILIISDMHQPYSHKDTLSFLTALNKKYKFDKIVCIGDEADNHAISFHQSDPDLDGAKSELDRAREALKPIYKLFPKVDVLDSNHGSLVYRKAKYAGLPSEVIKGYREVLKAPKGWNWYEDLILNTSLGPVYFTHGISSVAGTLSNRYSMSAVQGHYHSKSQVTWISSPERLRFDMHVGCLINDKSLAFRYNKLSPVRPIISIGIIIDGIASIVPMVLNKNGRWVGKL